MNWSIFSGVPMKPSWTPLSHIWSPYEKRSFTTIPDSLIRPTSKPGPHSALCRRWVPEKQHQNDRIGKIHVAYITLPPHMHPRSADEAPRAQARAPQAPPPRTLLAVLTVWGGSCSANVCLPSPTCSPHNKITTTRGAPLYCGLMMRVRPAVGKSAQLVMPCAPATGGI
jgi:hypothetical protein